MKIKVLIVDDSALIRSVMSEIINSQPDMPGFFSFSALMNRVCSDSYIECCLESFIFFKWVDQQRVFYRAATAGGNSIVGRRVRRG